MPTETLTWGAGVRKITSIVFALISVVAVGCITTTTGAGSRPPELNANADAARDFYTLALIAYDSGNLDVSLDYINQAIALTDRGAENRTQMILKRAEVNAGLGNWEPAENDVREVIATSPNTAEAYFVSALVYYMTNNLAGAERDLGQALLLKPAYARAHNLKGNIFKERGDLEGALKAYNDAVMADDTFAPAHFNRAETEMALGNYEAALTDYSSAIARYSELQREYLAQAYCGRARAYRMLGNTEMADRDGEEADLRVPGVCEKEKPTGPRWGKGEARPQ